MPPYAWVRGAEKVLWEGTPRCSTTLASAPAMPWEIIPMKPVPEPSLYAWDLFLPLALRLLGLLTLPFDLCYNRFRGKYDLEVACAPCEAASGRSTGTCRWPSPSCESGVPAVPPQTLAYVYKYGELHIGASHLACVVRAARP